MVDFNKAALIPVPHLNAVNFIGMGNKHEYLVWREKRGFFTALSKKGILSTWSNLTGKLLYSLRQEESSSREKVRDFQVYRSDDDDITYTRNLYNFEDFSLTLLCSNDPVEIQS